MPQVRSDWFILVQDWLRGGGEIGHSLPYLVGARGVICKNTKPSLEDASRLFDEIINNPVEGYIAPLVGVANLIPL